MKMMTEVLKKYSRASSFGAFAAAPMYPGAPRIAFDAEGGSGGGSDDGAEAAAAKAAAEKSAADQAAAEKAAAEKAAAEKEAADKAAAEAATKAGGDDKGLLAEVMAKKTKIKDLETQLAKFDGIDPDAVRALLEEKRANELAVEEAKGNFNRVKEMMVEEHNKALKALQDANADLQKQVAGKDDTINELTIGRSFSESKFIGEDLVLTRGKARALYASHFEVQDGKIVGFDKPAGAKERTVLTGADGNPVSFEDAIKKIIDADPEKDSLYRDKSKVGAGSQTTKVEQKQVQKNDKGLFGASRILAGLNAGK